MDTVNRGGLLGAIVHLIFALLFIFLNIPELTIINLIGAAIFFIGRLLFLRDLKFTIPFVAAGSFVIIAHAIIATYFIGITAGFALYIWLIPLFFILQVKDPSFLIISIIIVSLLHFYLHNAPIFTTGVYQLNPTIEKITSYFTSIGVVVTVMAVLLYFKDTVRKKEQIIIREIHHRIKNNLQVVSSMANIRNISFRDDLSEVAFDKLKMDVLHLSSIHNQINVTKDGITMNFIDFLNEKGTNLVSNRMNFDRSLKSLNIDLDLAVPLGLVCSQIFEHFIEIHDASNSKNGISIDLMSEADAYHLKINLHCNDITEFNTSPLKSIELEIIDCLAEQFDGKYQIDCIQGIKSFNILIPALV